MNVGKYYEYKWVYLLYMCEGKEKGNTRKVLDAQNNLFNV